MTCPHCGKYNTSNGKECEYCGKPLSVPPIKKVFKNNSVSRETPSSKTTYVGETRKGTGIIAFIVLGLLGLLVGLFVYDDEYKRQSFIEGWLKALYVCIGVALFVVVLIVLLINGCNG